MTSICFGAKSARVILKEERIEIQLSGGMRLQFVANGLCDDEQLQAQDEKSVVGKKGEYSYGLRLEQGRIVNGSILPENGKISVNFTK